MSTRLLVKISVLGLLIFAFKAPVMAQSVGISENTFSPNTQAILDLTSDRRGFLPPRMELNGDDLPIAGAKPTGLMVHNVGGAIGPNGLYYWTGSAWVQIATVQGSLSGSGTVNYMPKWTPSGTALGNSQLFDDGTNVGINTNAPVAKLTVRDGQESATQNDFKTALDKSGILISTDFTDNTYTPGVFWNSQNFQSTKPKAGIYLHQNNGGSKMILGTSTDYNVGLTNDALVIDDAGNIGVGVLAPAHKLSAGVATSDGQPVTVRGYSDIGNWKGGAAFGYTGASVIMGELSGVAQIGGHNATLGAWSNLALNSSGGNVGVGTTNPVMKTQVNSTGDDGIGISTTGWATIRMDGGDNKSLFMHYGGDGTNDLRFARAPNGLTGWEANVVRFDLDAPDASLMVDNAGNVSSASLAGTGTRMVTATAAGALATQAMPGGVLPAGTAAQTLYHNGTSWTNTSNLSNDGSTINLGSFINTDIDEWPKVTWLRDVGNSWDEGLIKAGSTRGVWGRAGFGIHMHSARHFAFFSSGWDPLLDIEGGTGRVYIKGNTGIGNSNPAHHLSVGASTADGQPVTVRGYSNTGSWKGGGAFGYSTANVIMGQLNGVAQIGGHNGNLSAWADLAINLGGNVGFGNAAPAAKVHIGPLNDNHLYMSSSNDSYGWRMDTRDNGGGSVPFRIFKRTNNSDTEVLTILNQNGNVGINTTTPGAKFHVHTTGTGGIGISDDGWASIRMDGQDTKSLWIHYGAGGTNDLRFARTGDGFGGWEANVMRFDLDAPGESMVLDGSGYLGLATLAGTGNRMVQANASGQLVISNDLPGGDADYVQNQYSGAQSANYWISGEARAKVFNFGHDNDPSASPAFVDGQFYRRAGQAEMAIDDWFYIRDNDGVVRLQFNSDAGQTVYGPNTGWGRYLRVGGNGGQTDEANIAATDGNLHIDSRAGSGIYLQYYTGNNTYINANGGFTGIGHASPGNTLHINRNSTDNRATVQISNTSNNSWGQTLLIRTTNVGTDGAKILFRSRDTKNWSIGGNNGDNAFVITEDGGDGQYGSGHGNTRFYVEPGGDIGINNTAPASKLHIGAGNADGIMLGNYNDQLGYNGTGALPHYDIRFAGYRDVVSNFTGAMISGVRYELCCSGLSQAMDLSFFVQPNTATVSGDGNLYERFRVYASGVLSPYYGTLSDKRLKSNFRDLSYGLNEVMQLQPVNYTQVLPKSLMLDEKGVPSDGELIESYGFVAQDLYNIIPEMVDKPENENVHYWTVDYGKLTPVLVKAIQEQQKQIEEGKQEREDLRREVEELKQMINSMRKD